MQTNEQPDVPIWAEAKANKRIDILSEVARSLTETELERSGRAVAKLTERDLEAEQLRLIEVLEAGSMTVDDFRRLQEIDYYLDGMRHRRQQGPSYEGWPRESRTE